MNEKKLARDELIGLDVKIVKSTDPSWVGKEGQIIDETKNTFLIKIKDQEKTIAKKTSVFEFKYNDKKITIPGIIIAYKPWDRIKKVR